MLKPEHLNLLTLQELHILSTWDVASWAKHFNQLLKTLLSNHIITSVISIHHLLFLSYAVELANSPAMFAQVICLHLGLI